MILTHNDIKEQIGNQNIVVLPLIESHISTNSIDLTLNEKLKIYTGDVLDVKKDNPTKDIVIPKEGYVLKPRTLYLAATNEYTETRGFVPCIEGKSSLARLGLFVHITAGFGDDGFCGHWTLELVATKPIRIYPDMKICQIVYHKASSPSEKAYNERKDAKYNNQTSVPQSSKMYENF